MNNKIQPERYKKICALIPARSNSKRVKDKNIRELDTVPLLVWSILTALDLQPVIDRVVVSSDSPAYGKIAETWGAEWLERPAVLSGDGIGDYDVVRHFLEHCPCDLVVYLRPTTPFRTSHTVREAIKIMLEGGYDSLRSVEEMSESAFKCFRIRAGLLYPLSRKDLTDRPNQTLERTYHPNGYVDIVRSDIVMEGSLWGSGRYAFVTPRAIEIDTEADFEYAQYLAQKERRWEFGKNQNKQVV